MAVHLPLQRFMKRLFGDPSIEKLMFDCRSDCDALFHLWRVDCFKGILDVQLLEAMTRKNKRKGPQRIKSLKTCLAEFCVGETATQDTVSQRMRAEGSAFWMERPLDPTLLQYASEDVALLPALVDEIIERRSADDAYHTRLPSASARYAWLKVNVVDSAVLKSQFWNHSLLPLGVLEPLGDHMQRCQGCKMGVIAMGSKSMYCGVCQKVKREDGVDPTLLRKTAMCRRADGCLRKMWGDCWYAHSEEELRCAKFALGEACDGLCGLKHTCLQAIGVVSRQQLQAIKFSKEYEGCAPALAGVDYVIDLPTLRSVIPHFLLKGIAASSEESRKKKGWYGAQYLSQTYIADRLGKQGYITRESALATDAGALKLFRDLLIVETAQSLSDVRAYDIHNATISRVTTSTDGHYRIDCKGLAEKRPSVLRGDRVRVRDNTTMQWHKGCVWFVNLDHVVVSFGAAFRSTGTTFLVIFSMPETNWRKQFLALDEAPVLTANYVSRHFAECHARGVDYAQFYPALARMPLNTEQLECINRILHPTPRDKHHLVLLHGPPGTGKTTTLVAAIAQLLAQGRVDCDGAVQRPRILVATPSNEAANLLFERLVAQGVVSGKHVRLLAESYNVQDCPKTVRQFAEPASKLGLENLQDKELVVCTLMVTGTMYTMGLKKGNFSHIAIDEAGQATETELLAPLQFIGPFTGGTSVTFAGDHKQLGPVLRSMPCQLLGFGVSTLERLMKSCRTSSVQLLDSYRAHPSIMAVYNELTYNNTLRAKAPLHEREHLKGTTLFPSGWWLPYSPFHPLSFYHVEGHEAREEDSPSWKNELEASRVVSLVEELLLTGRVQFEDIVVLTPYLKQCQVIRDKLHHQKFETNTPPFVKPHDYHRSRMPVRVCSVESFQGRESPVVILSCVRSQELSEVPNDHRQSIGFLQQPQRLNVAISRAIAGLFVVGNIGTLMSDPHWEKLIHIFMHFNAVIDPTGNKMSSRAFAQVRASYAYKVTVLQGHAKEWTAGPQDEDEEKMLPPMDTDWNRPE
eukprot:TRINITY_DN1427_c0_g1_i1.p1 TRINITY_DN1427_c0_g1~~TRINITY_DN1427_c0_g1_i1.p1  ORF type:complete len:1138 (+),score=314.44 TRINITY_DN1427_c0_g1_i1:335-3415(+)